MKKYFLTLLVLVVVLCGKNISNATSVGYYDDYTQVDTLSSIDSLLLSIDTIGLTMGFNHPLWFTPDSVVIHEEGEMMDLRTYVFANDVNLSDKFIFQAIDSLGNMVAVDSVNVSEMDTLFNQTNYRTENSFLFQVGVFEYQHNMQVGVRLLDSMSNQIDSILIPINHL